ncbi:MAG TPA: SWIM zinc finger family protein [Actinophytocola sp.]|uniref:SWIM zinc finger family protein n=1 Tax=Actinophytocola sp. TaxID=1872138 RepID=UPI002DB9B789|nr:SWIM zinc finger family protein [Actinophytocola sp.]HEU5470310.1 SWIM zinc finger family protein [Actinophytocola sp.]
MPFWDDPDYAKSGPIRVENGIRARSRRGDIGDSWWSRRFLDVLESLELGGRLARGRSYARSGQVLSLEVSAGAVTAVVQGSRPRPYRVRIGLAVLTARQWTRVERALAEQVIFGAKLLAGELPPDLEQVFAGLKIALFPRRPGDLAMTCSCPDDSVACKHIAAALYLLAEAFDADPFLVLAWRGRDRTTLLANLRLLSTADQSRPRRSPLDELRGPHADVAERVSDFYACQGRLTRLQPHPADIVVPDAVLLERDPLPLEVDGVAVVDLLRPAYLAMAGGAETVPPG